MNTYSYDTANRLVSITAGASTTSYAYNGLGDRLRQTTGAITTTYTLDLNAGLTQVLADGTNTYLYGNGRIGELQPTGFVYHLPDALGSVRQLSTSAGAPSLSQTFKPFGERMTSGGSGTSSYGFTGEWQQGGTVHLRARYYTPASGRFLSRDTWAGDIHRPMSYNPWLYGYGNPVRYTDPSGNVPCALLPPEDQIEAGCSHPTPPPTFANLYGVMFTADNTNIRKLGFADFDRNGWTDNDQAAVIQGVKHVAAVLADVTASLGMPLPDYMAFQRIFGSTNFYFMSAKTLGNYCERLTEQPPLAAGVMCNEYSRNKITPQLTAHELGHVFNAIMENTTHRSPYDELYSEGIHALLYDARTRVYSLEQIAGVTKKCTGYGKDGNCNNYYLRTSLGYAAGTRQNPNTPTQSEECASKIWDQLSDGLG